MGMDRRIRLVREIRLPTCFIVPAFLVKKVEHATGLTSPQLWAIKILAEAAPMMVSELAQGLLVLGLEKISPSGLKEVKKQIFFLDQAVRPHRGATPPTAGHGG